VELVLEPLVSRRHPSLVIAVVATTSAAVGCANHNNRSEAYLRQLEAGRWDAAVGDAERAVRDGPERNRVLDRLELGTVQRIAGDWKASDATFGEAWALMQELGDPADPQFVDTLAAIAVNERALPYIGGSVDRTMCATLRGLDLLAIGDLDSARAEFKRAQFAQEDAEARFAARIEEARSKMEQEQRNLGAIEGSSEFRSQYEQTYGDLAERFSPYEGWTVPFADWLTAILLVVDGEGGGDANRAVDLLRRVVGTVGENAAVERDLELARASFSSPTERPRQTWLVVESGFAPRREEVVFRIPAFIPEMPFIGVAFPRLVPSDAGPVGATIAASGGTPVPAVIVCDMGSVIAHEFEANLPLITGRAIGAAVAKAAASLAANLTAKESGNDWVLLASLVATNVYGYATTLADLRTWRTLPRAYAIAAVETPEDGVVRLSGGIGDHEVRVPPQQDAMIIVRCPRAGGPTSIHAFPLARPVEEADADPSTSAAGTGDVS
jgi:hypothetical protein